MDEPPDPATIPVLGELKSDSEIPDISIASNAAKYAYADASPINLNSFLSISSEKFKSTEPET